MGGGGIFYGRTQNSVYCLTQNLKKYKIIFTSAT
jgi:hypothetical protein